MSTDIDLLAEIRQWQDDDTQGYDTASLLLCRAADALEALTSRATTAEVERDTWRRDMGRERDDQIARVLRHQETIEDQQRDIDKLLAERDALTAQVAQQIKLQRIGVPR